MCSNCSLLHKIVVKMYVFSSCGVALSCFKFRDLHKMSSIHHPAILIFISDGRARCSDLSRHSKI